MKLKKKTSMMLVASAAVAAVGIAAVSFAAWTGTNKTLTANAATGEAILEGFSTANGTLELGTLVPYDQPVDSIKANDDGVKGTTYVSVQIPEYTVYEDYDITVESNTDLTFYVLVSATQVTAAPATVDAATTAGWKQVTSGGVKFDFEFGDTNTPTTYISMILVSSDTDQQNSSASFTVTLNK